MGNDAGKGNSKKRKHEDSIDIEESETIIHNLKKRNTQLESENNKLKSLLELTYPDPVLSIIHDDAVDFALPTIRKQLYYVFNEIKGFDLSIIKMIITYLVVPLPTLFLNGTNKNDPRTDVGLWLSTIHVCPKYELTTYEEETKYCYPRVMIENCMLVEFKRNEWIHTWKAIIVLHPSTEIKDRVVLLVKWTRDRNLPSLCGITQYKKKECIYFRYPRVAVVLDQNKEKCIKQITLEIMNLTKNNIKLRVLSEQ